MKLLVPSLDSDLLPLSLPSLPLSLPLLLVVLHLEWWDQYLVLWESLTNELSCATPRRTLVAETKAGGQGLPLQNSVEIQPMFGIA